MAEPKLPFANDGSFLEMFSKMQEQQKAAGSEAAVPPPPPPAQAPEGDGDGCSGSDGTAAQQADGGAAAGSSDSRAQGAVGTQDAAGTAAVTDAADAARPPPPPRTASEPAPPPAAARPSSSGRLASAPSMLLKAKKPIVQVRTRTGEALQPGAKRAKKEQDKGADGDAKSFYLQELERYRQVACESSAGSDRPLVK